MTELEAAECFIEARRNRPKWSGVPPAFRPRTMEDGYRVQKIAYQRIEAAGDKRVGYKVGAVAPANRQYFGIDEPIYAGIFQSGAMNSLDDIRRAGLIEPSIECEIALVLGGDPQETGKPLTREAIADAVASCHIACEVIDNRYGDLLSVGVPTLLVDDFCNVGFVLGPANSKWREIDLSNLRGETRIDDTVVTGNSADVLDALTAVQWLSNKLAAVGSALRQGDIILTGSLVVPTRLPQSARALSLWIEGFGELDLTSKRPPNG